MQCDAVGHATPTRVLPPCAPCGLGLWTIDQADPFHDSMSVTVNEPGGVSEPVAIHADRLLHETAAKPLYACPLGLGLRTIDQAEPFQDSVRVTGIELLFVYDPTATQNDALTHETPLSPTSVPPFGTGLRTTVQDEPFHISASAHLWALLSVKEPTATQREALAQEIASSWLPTAPCGRRLGTTDQEEPFQDSVRTLMSSLALYAPTARQNETRGQDTLFAEL